MCSSRTLNKSGSYEDYEVESELRNDFILIIVSNMSNRIFEAFAIEIHLVCNVKIKCTFTQHRSGEMWGTHGDSVLVERVLVGSEGWRRLNSAAAALCKSSIISNIKPARRSHKLRLTVRMQYITK